MALDPSYAFYSEGTISLTNGSDIATGDFVAWDPAVLPFDFVFPNDGTSGMSVIEEVLAMDQIRLAKPWTGPTLTNVPYFMVRWTRHTDPRIYALRVSDYLARLKAIPENIDEVAGEISADRQAVDAAMVLLSQIQTNVDADREAAQTAAGTASQSATTATQQAGIAQQWAEAASSTVLPDNSVTNAKLGDVPTSTLKGRVTAGTGDPQDLTPAQVRGMLASELDANYVGLSGNDTKTGNLTLAPASGSASLSITAANTSTEATVRLGQTGGQAWVAGASTSGDYIIGVAGTAAAYTINITGTTVVDHTWGVGGATKLQLSATYLIPGADNGLSLGLSGFRWSVVYAVTGAINTSDAREKANFDEADEALFDAVLSVPLFMYQWKDAIEEKGADGARLHYGPTAQGVRDAIAAKGLDPNRYALFCEDELPGGGKRFGLRLDQFDRLKMEAVWRKVRAANGV